MGIDKINTNNQIYNKTAVKVPEPKQVTETAKPSVKQERPDPTPAPKHTERKKEAQPSATAKIEEKTEEIIENTKKVKNAIAEVNKKMNQKTHCEFSYHEDTKRVSIKVIDSETDEIIREIPPEETLNMLSKMWEVAGILIDEHR